MRIRIFSTFSITCSVCCRFSDLSFWCRDRRAILPIFTWCVSPVCLAFRMFLRTDLICRTYLRTFSPSIHSYERREPRRFECLTFVGIIPFARLALASDNCWHSWFSEAFHPDIFAMVFAICISMYSHISLPLVLSSSAFFSHISCSCQSLLAYCSHFPASHCLTILTSVLMTSCVP